MTKRYKIKYAGKTLVSEVECIGRDTEQCEWFAFDYADQVLDEKYGLNSQEEREKIELIEL